MKLSVAVFVFLMLTSLLVGSLSLFPPVEAAANIQVIQHSAYYRENKMSFTIVGEVQNFGDQTARIDKITATMYNIKNEVVATLEAMENYNLYCLLPGRKSPFLIGIMHYDIPFEDYHAFDHYTINVECTAIPSPPLGFKILSHKGELKYTPWGSVAGYQINSTVQYTGKEPKMGGYIRVYATVYDASGKILGVRGSNYAYWEDPATATAAHPQGWNETFVPNQIGFSEPIWFEERGLFKAFSMEEFWLASSIASYELTGEVMGYPMPGSWGEENPYYALDTGQDAKPPSTPSPVLPANAVKVDRSSIAPINQIEDVPTGQPHVFEYKDLTLVVETAGAPVTLNVTASEINQRTVKISVELEEATRLDIAIGDEVAKLEQAKDQQEAMTKQTLATIGFYMALEQHSSPDVKATFGLHIDEAKLNEELGRSVDVSRLSWFYWDITQQGWVSVSSSIDQDGYLVCETNHFSIWMVAEFQFEDDSVAGIRLEYLAAIAVIVIVVLVTAIIIKKRK